jgi:hypothetical protein
VHCTPGHDQITNTKIKAGLKPASRLCRRWLARCLSAADRDVHHASVPNYLQRKPRCSLQELGHRGDTQEAPRSLTIAGPTVPAQHARVLMKAVSDPR